MKYRGFHLLVALSLIGSLFSFSPVPSAQAAVGDLNFLSCVGNNIPGCGDVAPSEGAEGATALAFSAAAGILTG